MAPITTVSFTREERQYEVKIAFDDRAIMYDQLVFEVDAKVTDEQGREHSEALTLEVDLGERIGRILHEGAEWYRFSFDDLPVRMDQDGNESPVGLETGEAEGAADEVAEAVEEGIGAGVAGLIDAMPVPDPILGCALKAGISSTVGQTIACNEVVGADGSARQRAWRVVRCLGEHVGGIFTRTLWRAARCMVGLGFV